ncbi:DNA-binding CsgD family transcriptional regulator [Sphingomonas naasensis]|uniref:LuxR family transcriptional regulator n=1 Tax=Sphingomonas naasensis TaxID=1344951 RepID=A0A4S1WCC7_9SPHN|nr:helix-turn-helix transcriptional regulator [Sphingomonas naasensis]NIJ21117.1 DNA-binding CsgD family transcriptional regulator [Sphingomonas naasensis]TGX38296.1 LuxR family transcriptional regulator [Sphingomonas naasensis]
MGASRFGKTHLDCLALVAEGKSSKVIARRLALSQNTVDSYMRDAITHFGVDNRFEAAHAAARAGLIEPASTLRPQPQPVAPDAESAMFDPSYEPPPPARTEAAVRETSVRFAPDLPEPAIVRSGSIGAVANASSSLHVLLKIAALSVAMVVVLSAAEPIGHGFQALAALVVELRLELFSLPTR